MRAKTMALLAVVAAVVTASCSKDPAVSRQEAFGRGNRYVEQKKYPEAVVEYRKAIQIDPKFGEARYALGEVYDRLGDDKNAYGQYVRAADLLPDNIEAQRKAGDFLIAAEKFEDAKARAQKIMSKDPVNMDGLLMLATASTGLKDLDAAMFYVEEAIKAQPNKSRPYVALAKLQLAQGHPEQAEATFKRAEQLGTDAIAANLGLARLYGSTGRIAEAETELGKALKIDGNSEVAHKELATLYMATRQWPKVEAHFKWLADHSTELGPQLQLADYYVLMDRRPEAVKVLEPLSSRPGALEEVQIRLASIKYSDGDHPAAHKIIDEVLKRDPARANALMVKAGFLSTEGKTDEAIARVKAVIAADPKSSQAHHALADGYAVKKEFDQAIKEYREALRLDPNAFVAQVQIARFEMLRGNVSDAMEAARAALKLQPENADAQLVLAQGYRASGDLGRDETTVKQLLAKYPTSAGVEAERGHLLQAKRDIPGARRAFERALELDPKAIDPLTALVALDATGGKGPQARARVEARLAKTPNDAELLVLAARTYLTLGALDDGVNALRRAIEAEPSNMQAFGMLAQFYVTQHRTEAALTEYSEIVKRNPQSVYAHTAIGLLLEAQNKMTEAQKQYERVMQIDPRAPVAANNLAWIYAQNGGNLDEALKLAQAAKEKLQDNPEINDTLGWVYYKKDMGSLAIRAFKDSLQKDPKNPTYHYHLGLAYLAAQDRPNGRASLERALAIKPDFDGAADARNRLAN